MLHGSFPGLDLLISCSSLLIPSRDRLGDCEARHIPTSAHTLDNTAQGSCLLVNFAFVRARISSGHLICNFSFVRVRGIICIHWLERHDTSSRRTLAVISTLLLYRRLALFAYLETSRVGSGLQLPIISGPQDM